MRCMLLGYSFEPRPNSRALGIAEPVLTVGLSIKGCSHSQNQFDERQKDRLVRKFGLRCLQRFVAIQAEPPFLFFDQKDKKRGETEGDVCNNC